MNLPVLPVFRVHALRLQHPPPLLVSVHQSSVRVSGGVVVRSSRPLSGTRQTKNDPSSQEEAGGDKRHAQSSSRLIFTAVRQVCGQEGGDDFVGEPGRGDQAQEAGQDEAAPRSDGRVPLRSVAAPPAGAFEPQGGEAETERRHQAGQNHGGSRGLQIRRQRQHGVLHGAAEDAGAVPDAVHPQTLHLRDGGHDAGPGVDAHLPVGQQSGHGGAEDAQERQGERQDLNGGGQHGSAPPSSSGPCWRGGGVPGRSWQQIIPQHCSSELQPEEKWEVKWAWRAHSCGCWRPSSPAECCVSWLPALVSLQLMWWSLTLNYVHLKLQRLRGLLQETEGGLTALLDWTYFCWSNRAVISPQHLQPEQSGLCSGGELSLTCVESLAASPRVIPEDGAERSRVNEITGCVG